MAIPAPASGANANDVMANLAARLMGRMGTSAPLAQTPASQTSKEAPRTFPSPRAPAPVKVTPPQATSKAVQPSIAKENSPLKSPAVQAKPVQAVQELDVDMPDADKGPSLFGTADQLAAAREFSQAATQGGGKSKPRPEKRQRLLSKEPTSFSSGSSSPRSSAASLAASGGYPPLSATPRSRPALRSHAGSHTSSASTVTARTVTGESTATGTPAAAWSAFAAKPTTQVSNKEDDSVPKSFDKVAVTHAHPAPSTTSPDKKNDSAKPRLAWQLADITNTLKDRATTTESPPLKDRGTVAESPPHLRVKAAAVAEPQKIAVNGMAHDSVIAQQPISHTKSWSITNGVPKVIASDSAMKVKAMPEAPGGSTEAEDVKMKASAFEPAENKSIVTQESNDHVSRAQTNGTATATKSAAATQYIAQPTQLGRDDINLVQSINGLLKELKSIGERVASLEHENFTMQKHIESMLQSEERRKFLGTDKAAKVPFAIDVQHSSGWIENVQVNAELKVSELIRRVRAKADLPPAVTLNPRISINGEQVGHGMTLGEAGVTKDKKGTVTFSFDNAK